MPCFIGNPAPGGAVRIHDNARPAVDGSFVRLTYSQVVLLPPEAVRYSLDTTDRGSRGLRAKRWYRWFASAEAIQTCPRATEAMRRRACGLYPWLPWRQRSTQ